MKTPLLFTLVLLGLTAPAVADEYDAAALAGLAKGHEKTFHALAGGHPAIVLQHGEKQFVIYGVTSVRAVGSTLEVTVKNGPKYSVNPADVFFITNDSFGLK